MSKILSIVLAVLFLSGCANNNLPKNETERLEYFKEQIENADETHYNNQVLVNYEETIWRKIVSISNISLTQDFFFKVEYNNKRYYTRTLLQKGDTVTIQFINMDDKKIDVEVSDFILPIAASPNHWYTVYKYIGEEHVVNVCNTSFSQSVGVTVGESNEILLSSKKTKKDSRCTGFIPRPDDVSLKIRPIKKIH